MKADLTWSAWEGVLSCSGRPAAGQLPAGAFANRSGTPSHVTQGSDPSRAREEEEEVKPILRRPELAAAALRPHSASKASSSWTDRSPSRLAQADDDHPPSDGKQRVDAKYPAALAFYSPSRRPYRPGTQSSCAHTRHAARQPILPVPSPRIPSAGHKSSALWLACAIRSPFARLASRSPFSLRPGPTSSPPVQPSARAEPSPLDTPSSSRPALPLLLPPGRSLAKVFSNCRPERGELGRNSKSHILPADVHPAFP